MAELFAKKKWARIWEAKDMSKDNENAIRIYMTQSPDVFAFQIRTFKPITGQISKTEGKKRNMIAHIELTLTELEQIVEFCKEDTGDMTRVNTKPLDLITPSDES